MKPSLVMLLQPSPLLLTLLLMQILMLSLVLQATYMWHQQQRLHQQQ